jgi:hypothetical protein
MIVSQVLDLCRVGKHSIERIKGGVFGQNPSAFQVASIPSFFLLRKEIKKQAKAMDIFIEHWG